jgi:hypothetical protein
MNLGLFEGHKVKSKLRQNLKKNVSFATASKFEMFGNYFFFQRFSKWRFFQIG